MLCCLGVVAGCGTSAVTVQPTRPTGAAAASCRALVADLPRSVADVEARPVEPTGVLAGGWGDPPIVLRCGVPKPPRLHRSSSCAVVDDVGWFAEKSAKGYVFTTIGRSTYVEVTVPEAYAPPATALVDLAGTIKRHISERIPCQ